MKRESIRWLNWSNQIKPNIGYAEKNREKKKRKKVMDIQMSYQVPKLK